jgi:hypothetical protein
VSGRIASIAVDPGNSNHWLIGAADGGVWATSNAGTTWIPLTDKEASLAMGAIAFAPSNPNIIYAGTGDRIAGVGVYPGDGLLKSTDAGRTWRLLARGLFAGSSFSDILVNPTNPDTVLATTTGYNSVGVASYRPPSVPERGIFKSTDGGVTWSHKGPTLSVGFVGNGTDLEVDPTSFSHMYAGIGQTFAGQTNGVYRSTDAGDTWTPISGPWSSLPARVGLVALAIAPSNPAVLYVSIMDVGNDGLLGLWRTDNAWDATPTWTPIPPGNTGSGYCADRCRDLLDIIVDPTNPNVLYASGVDLWKCTNCGATPTWTNVTNGIHVDQRAEAWAGNRLIVGNDGGVYSTTDGGTTWTSHNTNLSITQFVAGCLHPADATFAIAGSIDNGVEKTTIHPPTWHVLLGGDGGRCAFSSRAPNTNWAFGGGGGGFGSLRTLDGGTSFQDVSAGLNLSGGAVSIASPFEKCPANDDVFLMGNSTLWRINNYFSGVAPSWSANSPRLDEQISAVAFAAQDKTCNTYAYGTQFGTHLRITSNGGATWVDLDSGNVVPNRYVTGLAFDPTNSNILYVTLAGFDETIPGQPGHVFKTTNALSGSPVWSNVSPPANVQHNTIAVDGSDPNTVYVGTDFGVWKSTNGAGTWIHMGLGHGMPNVAVYDIKINDATDRVAAFTHGRGAFELTHGLNYLRHNPASGLSTFGTISTIGVVTDLFDVGYNFDALTFTTANVGYGPNLFYYLRHDATGFSTFGTISTSGIVTDRFGVGFNFDALTFTTANVGYGPNLFYYLRHDTSGFSHFGTISTSGAVNDRLGAGFNFDALTFTTADVGYGPNLFYYLRHDTSGFSHFGTISASGAVTDRFGAGFNLNALTFTTANLGYGHRLFYYLRHDATGFSTFGTISTSGAVNDRFGVGNHFDALTVDGP